MILYPFKRLLTSSAALACLSAAAVVHATCPTTAGRFVANGAEVTDTKTDLIWQRCSAGQSWSGSTCTGSAGSYTHEQALVHAKTQNTTASPTGWRLPSVKELASLADKGCQSPAIDSTAFPATLSSWYWSSSPYVSNSSDAWCVYFYDGSVFNFDGRNDTYQVRLVRSR
jgi:hypothetical protein